MKTISINLNKNRAYDILIGRDNLGAIGTQLKAMNVGESIFIITDSKVGGLYAERLIDIFRKAGFHDTDLARFPHGEKSKNIKTYTELMTRLAKFDGGFNKNVLVVNLGGGVPGDVGGFVAATFNRGVNYVQIPTTLLANVDSGIGGKVGIDFHNIKNKVGSFHQPVLVFVDLSLLKTLNLREIRSGLAEVVKYGVIADPPLLGYVEKHVKDILALNLDVIEPIVEKSYRLKARIVEQDEKDTRGIRMVLNYGHTIGHAVESAAGFKYSHGESVSIGMVCANDLACEIGIFNRPEAERIETLLSKIGLPVKIAHCKLADIIRFLKHDKKSVNGANRFVLPVKLGKTEIKSAIPPELIKKVLKKRMA
ncbi:MAG: 3-dehydroquinate synthase [Candidatus Omnitrophota bacterium]|nr:3-dehydroquinate synthase [Candidatus Omnitrophota bacterium]